MITTMKYYKDKDDNVYAYDDDGSQDKFIKKGLELISIEEAISLVNPPPTKEQQVFIAEQQKQILIREASYVIEPLVDAKVGGYISDTDIQKLDSWQRYRYSLTKVDTSKAPDVTFPTVPDK
ncbi:tail fiber assembly protein [Citrobacter sp. Cpo090]|uniref:tail fiber assembly protein n=1 Tax=Citrobacter sp. Cpo090 TaxID=2985139 RepID=UPI00257621EA|nr:tail fiber assembly protein [Citrobacter sp. Cpo090]MDM2843242.1 tail fiber assembly protein [Citrobacter sp. Cpo090]